MARRKSTELKQGELLKRSERQALDYIRHSRSRSPTPANARTPSPAPRTPPPARSRSSTPVNDRYLGRIDHTKGIRLMDDIPAAPKNSYRVPRRSRSRSCADEVIMDPNGKIVGSRRSPAPTTSNGTRGRPRARNPVNSAPMTSTSASRRSPTPVQQFEDSYQLLTNSGRLRREAVRRSTSRAPSDPPRPTKRKTEAAEPARNAKSKPMSRRMVQPESESEEEEEPVRPKKSKKASSKKVVSSESESDEEEEIRTKKTQKRSSKKKQPDSEEDEPAPAKRRKASAKKGNKAPPKKATRQESDSEEEQEVTTKRGSKTGKGKKKESSCEEESDEDAEAAWLAEIGETHKIRLNEMKSEREKAQNFMINFGKATKYFSSLYKEYVKFKKEVSDSCLSSSDDQ